MHRTMRSLVGTAAGALAITLAAPTAAHAETQTAKDPRGDVETITSSARAAAKRDVDIISSTNRYLGGTLRLSITAVNLRATGYEASWLVRAGGETYVGYYQAIDGGVGFGFLSTEVRGRPGNPSCPGLMAGADRETDRITMRVPATCFGEAESVRIAAVAGRRIDEGRRSRVDDARRDGIDQDQRAKFGPSLERN